MASMKEVLTFPHCFFFSMIAPLNVEELDNLAPCDTILLIQDLDGVLGIAQIQLEWGHFWQYNINGCLSGHL
jgi:hypothetical protein